MLKGNTPGTAQADRSLKRIVTNFPWPLRASIFFAAIRPRYSTIPTGETATRSIIPSSKSLTGSFFLKTLNLPEPQYPKCLNNPPPTPNPIQYSTPTWNNRLAYCSIICSQGFSSKCAQPFKTSLPMMLSRCIIAWELENKWALPCVDHHSEACSLTAGSPPIRQTERHCNKNNLQKLFCIAKHQQVTAEAETEGPKTNLRAKWKNNNK